MADNSTTGTAVVEQRRRLNVYSAASFVVLILCVGLPVWYRTTSVHRPNLPYGSIEALLSRELHIAVYIDFVVVAENTANADSFTDAFSEQVKLALVPPKIQNLEFDMKWSFRTSTQMEHELLQNSASLEDFDAAVFQSLSGNSSTSRHITWFLFTPKMHLPIWPGSSSVSVYLGANRSFYSRITPIVFRALVSTVIFNTYLSSDTLFRVNEAVRTPSSVPQRSGERSTSFPLSPETVLELYVLFPSPEHYVELDYEAIASNLNYFFLANLRDIANVELQSQAVYGVDFARKPQHDKERGIYYFPTHVLSSLVTPLESHVSATITNKKNFNIVLYVTPPSTDPLYIGSAAEGTTTGSSYSNGFIVSDWGGVIVFNPQTLPRNKTSNNSNGDLLRITGSMIEQLRVIFGLGQPLPDGIIKAASPLADWELDQLRLHATVSYLLKSVATLRSLTDLLNKIPNIVISDQIGEQISVAVAATEDSFNSFDDSVQLNSSKVSFQFSEMAFFDPSLLSLLYFPDDQKYAIYIPLFLPVGFPVLMSLMLIVSYANKSSVRTAK